MKTFIRRCTLAVIMCGMSATGMAKDILSQNFNNFNGLVANSVVRTTEGWTTTYCETTTNRKDNTKALWLGSSSGTAYAISPTLNYIGNAILSFTMAKTNKDISSCSITVSINNGTIEGESSQSVSTSSQDFTDSKNFNLILEQGATIKFTVTSRSAFVAIDDVVVSPVITLSESTDNSDIISGANEMTMDIKTNRTLTKNIWNTICLPFDITTTVMEQALGTGKDIQMRTYKSYSDDVMTFEEATSIPAGTPFLIKISGDKNAVNPTFKAVTVKNTAAQTVTHNGVSFIGTYSPTPLSPSDVFITKEGGLSYADGESSILGMRAYISGDIPSGARLSIDGIADGIDNVLPETANTDGQWYTLSGTRIAKPTSKGIYVRDGKKIIIKK